jgi:hypothetical protein
MIYLDVEDMLDQCSTSDIQEIIKYLENHKYISKNSRRSYDNPLDILFKEDIQKISFSRLRLTNDEEEIIKRIADRL